MIRPLFHLLVVALLLAAPLAAQEPAIVSASPKNKAHQRIVYRLNYMPATDVARTLNEVFASAESEIVPELISNSLIVHASAESTRAIMELLVQLDRRPALVSLELIHTMLGFTPRVGDNAIITMEVDFTKSRLATRAPNGGAADDQAHRRPQVDTLSLQTTIHVASGNSVVVGGVRSTDRDDWDESLVIISALAVVTDLTPSDE